MAAIQTHEFKVTMTCEGCSGAVERVLSKYKGKGVEEVLISIPEQKVNVKTTLTANEILEVIKKTGKECEYLATN
ncbi:PREDICTED: metal homeostasis factor ATX1 [Nicrophorus vespilloides]|uniref:Copper transport protein ATOX1 n=1 Tax=Nicrophorus vespilloides TaxID=110193 RepID=A0ABM1N7T6_NICVS|nr:PREDICTED: metal homeostasis factor ATX1 [Nicrophorus vespilloides]